VYDRIPTPANNIIFAVPVSLIKSLGAAPGTA